MYSLCYPTCVPSLVHECLNRSLSCTSSGSCFDGCVHCDSGTEDIVSGDTIDLDISCDDCLGRAAIRTINTCYGMATIEM